MGARGANSIEDLAKWADVIITMLANDEAVESVIIGDENSLGVFGVRKPDQIHICMSSISVKLSSELERLHKDAGQHYVAAPVFGRPDKAQQGKLYIMAGGDAEQLDKCSTIFGALGQGTFNMGDKPHLAHLTKIAINFMLASFVESASEAFVLVEKGGVNKAKFFELMSTALLRSPAFEGYAKRILDEQFRPAGFALTLGLKDVNLALAAASENEVPMPIASLMHDIFLAGIAQGYGECDWSAASLVARANAGMTVDLK
jgi:3-hydroxyisobutyrate dehydrogenase-like beta-hydroxyacid dehydrogenase